MADRESMQGLRDAPALCLSKGVDAAWRGKPPGARLAAGTGFDWGVDQVTFTRARWVLLA